VKRTWGSLIAALLMLLSACRRPESGQAPLRIAVLPIIDALPLYVADAEGYFAAEGLQVTLVPAGSAAERDQLLQAGQIDGMITDLVALMLYNRDETFVTAVRYAMVPTSASPQFRILASGSSGISTPEGLRDIPVGVSEGTVIEYVTYRLLQSAGLRASEIATVAVPRIPERMALLDAGGLSAATLPEPLASLALLQGAVPIVDDAEYPALSCSLYALRAEVVEARPDTVRRFVRAIDRAVETINTDKGHWSALTAEQQLVPTSLQTTYVLPDFPGSGVATAAQFADVLSWLQDSGRLDATLAYEASVTVAYLQGE
jgi:NitT/TauT family transport system substrate-binding protein